MSKARVDLPEPLTPVMTMKRFRGSSTSMFLRLCSRAPRITILLVGIWLKAEDGSSNGKHGSRGRLGLGGRLLLGFGLAAPFLLDLARDKLDTLGPAGPAGPQQGAVAQLMDNLGQGALQKFGRNHGDFQFQPVFRAFFSSRHGTNSLVIE